MSRSIWAIVVVALLSSTSWAQLKTYHIGNSLTWDTQPRAFDDFAEQRSWVHEFGHHIRSGSSLEQIVAGPGWTDVEPTDFGRWDTALAAHPWDVVTMQPHPTPGGASTLQDDVQSILTLIDETRSNPANADTTFVIYGAWPRTTGPFGEAWLAPADMNDPSTATNASRAYQRALFFRVAKARPGVNLAMLSIGELLYLADQEIRDAVDAGGDWFGFTDVDQLYRDSQHLSNESGRWLASLAMWSAVSGENPVGLTKPEGLFGSDATSPVAADPVHRDGLAQFVHESMDDIYLTPEPSTGLILLGMLTAALRRRA